MAAWLVTGPQHQVRLWTVSWFAWLWFCHIHNELRLMVLVDSSIGGAIGGYLGSFDLRWSLTGGAIALLFGAINYYWIAPALKARPS